MAGADYYSCDKCGRKTFYDAEVNYDGLGSMAALCEDCDKTHAAIIVERSQEAIRLTADAVVKAADAMLTADSTESYMVWNWDPVRLKENLARAVLAHRKAKAEQAKERAT